MSAPHEPGAVCPPPSPAAAIAGRRSARRFEPGRPVDPAVLEQVLRLAALAPSAYNLQPWRFVVVRDERNRRRLRACAFRQPKVSEAPIVVIVLGYLHPHRSHLGSVIDQQVAEGAATPSEAAEAAARARRALDGHPDLSSWATCAATRAATMLTVAAEALGIASAFIEEFEPEKVARAFGIPRDHTVAALVALGHAAEPAPFPGRLPLSELCFAEHFGQPWPSGGSGPTAPPLDPGDPPD